MPQVQAKRRLVKSPPELWTELSDAAALARHLGEFGEIRITRLVKESKVVWEGDRATGSVELNAAGWGTQVTLTVETPEPGARGGGAGGAGTGTRAGARARAGAGAGAEPEPEPVAVEAPPRPAAVSFAARRGFFARFFGRPDHVETVIEAAREAVELEPPPPEPEPEPVAVEPEPEHRSRSRAAARAGARARPHRGRPRARARPARAGAPPPVLARLARPADARRRRLSSLEEYQKDLEQQVADVADLIRRLKEEPDEPEAASA